jgi:hypothetical protein
VKGHSRWCLGTSYFAALGTSTIGADTRRHRLRQQRLVHRRRNLHSRAPDRQWPEIAIRARRATRRPRRRWRRCCARTSSRSTCRELPAVVQRFIDDFEACIATCASRRAIGCVAASVIQQHWDLTVPHRKLPLRADSSTVDFPVNRTRLLLRKSSARNRRSVRQRVPI